MSNAARATAVVVDEWPLVRLGIGQAMRSLSIRVVGQVDGALDGLQMVTEGKAGWLLLGTHHDVPTIEAVRRAGILEDRPYVVVLLDNVSRDGIASLLTVGADALLARSVEPDELADALSRVEKGERVVAPSLLPLLVGSLGTSVEAPEQDDGASAGDNALTRKELQVLTRLAEGRSNKEIADVMFVAPATIKTHLAHIYTKLGVTGRQEAVARAVELGLLR